MAASVHCALAGASSVDEVERVTIQHVATVEMRLLPTFEEGSRPASAQVSAERRQITVMFCNLKALETRDRSAPLPSETRWQYSKCCSSTRICPSWSQSMAWSENSRGRHRRLHLD
jgi:hypothetical protein